MGRKIDCTACGGDNFYVTDHNGFGYCFNCGYYSSEHTKQAEVRRSNAIPEIRQFYDRMASYYHSSLTTAARDWLYTRGFNDTTIQTLRIGYCPDDSALWYRNPIAKEAGLAVDGKAFFANRITFPYINTNNNTTTITDIRARSLVTDAVKYKSPLGSAYTRGADYPYNYFLHKHASLILTEGEIKAAIAYQYGYPAVALPGMSSWRHGFLQQPEQEVIIVLDTQPEDRYNIVRAIINIASRLHTCKVATLPTLGKKKMDIDTCIIEHGEDIFAKVVQAALPFDRWMSFRY